MDFEIGTWKEIASATVGGGVTVKLYGIVDSQDPINNTSVVRYACNYHYSGAYIIDEQGSGWVGDALHEYSAGFTQLNGGEATLVFSQPITISHNADGTGSAWAWATIRMPNWGYEGTASGSGNLPTIDRNAPVITQNDISNITASSFKISATSNYACSNWQYKVDNGEWTTLQSASGTSVEKTLTDLSPATSYSVQIRATRDYNEVVGTSSSKSVTTLGGAVINSVDDIAINDNGTLNINITVYNASYENKLTLKYGDDTLLSEWSIGTSNVGTQNKSVTLSSSQRNLIYSNMASVKKRTFLLGIKSYSSGRLIGGGNSANVKMTISANASPILANFTFEDSNSVTTAVTSDNQKIIKGQSTLKIKDLSVTLQNGASISEWKYEVGNQTKTGNPTSGNYSFGLVNSYGTLSLKVTVTDSRGYTASKELNVQVLNYTNIQINDYSLHRQNSNEVATILNLSGKFTSVGNNSLQTATYKYRVSGTQNWSSDIPFSPTTSGTNITFNDVLDSTHFLTANSYEVSITITDKLTSATVQGVVLKAVYRMVFREHNTGLNEIGPQATFDIQSDDIEVSPTLRLESVFYINDADYSEIASLLASAFDTSVTYYIGQFVTYNSSLYECNTQHTGEWNSAHFTEL